MFVSLPPPCSTWPSPGAAASGSIAAAPAMSSPGFSAVTAGPGSAAGSSTTGTPFSSSSTTSPGAAGFTFEKRMFTAPYELLFPEEVANLTYVRLFFALSDPMTIPTIKQMHIFKRHEKELNSPDHLPNNSEITSIFYLLFICLP